jgi:hypothetical protein
LAAAEDEDELNWSLDEATDDPEELRFRLFIIGSRPHYD